MKTAVIRKKTHLASLLTCTLALGLLMAGCNRQEEVQAVDEAKTKQAYSGTIIAMGDSLTAGLGVAEEDAWPALLETKLKKNGLNWQVINAGISGETSSGALARIKWILTRKPDIVIFETGANDGFRGIPPPVMKKNISRAVQLLRENGVTVILAGMRIVRNLGADYIREFAAIYPAVAGEQDVLLIPFFLKGVAGEPSLNQADSIHPNEKGHRIIAETVFPFTLKAIQQTTE
jgi:acyl-CoA thioesterase-1